MCSRERESTVSGSTQYSFRVGQVAAVSNSMLPLFREGRGVFQSGNQSHGIIYWSRTLFLPWRVIPLSSRHESNGVESHNARIYHVGFSLCLSLSLNISGWALFQLQVGHIWSVTVGSTSGVRFSFICTSMKHVMRLCPLTCNLAELWKEKRVWPNSSKQTEPTIRGHTADHHNDYKLTTTSKGIGSSGNAQYNCSERALSLPGGLHE